MDRALIILCALTLNAVLAGPRRWYVAMHLTRVARFPSSIVRDLERRLNRERRSLSEREMRGAILVTAFVVIGMFFGWALSLFNQGFLDMLLLAACLPVRPTWDCALSIRKSLRVGDLTSARNALEDTAWRHHALLDDHGAARAAIEMLAAHFSDKIVAPIFWYLSFGLPGLLVSKVVYLLQETLAQPGDGRKGFGMAAQTTHYIMHYIPSRIAAALWLAASLFLPTARVDEQVKQLSPYLAAAPSQTVALVSAAAALRLSLGGPGSIYAEGVWLGNGIAKAGSADIKRALYLFALLHLLLFALVGCFL